MSTRKRLSQEEISWLVARMRRHGVLTNERIGTKLSDKQYRRLVWGFKSVFPDKKRTKRALQLIVSRIRACYAGNDEDISSNLRHFVAVALGPREERQARPRAKAVPIARETTNELLTRINALETRIDMSEQQAQIINDLRRIKEALQIV